MMLELGDSSNIYLKALANLKTLFYICSAYINMMVSPFRRASVIVHTKYGLFLCPVGTIDAVEHELYT